MLKVSVTLNTGGLVRDVEQFTDQLAKDLLVAAKKYTPIRSGNARRGWAQTKTQQGAAIENKVPYIERLENNHSKQTRGKGIINPTLTEIKGKYK